MTKLMFTILLMLTLPSGAFTQTRSGVPPHQESDRRLTAKIDSLFTQWDKPDSPGCALTVIKDGRLVYTRGYGMANLEYDIPISPSSIFYIGSTSKQFTGMCIALLAQQGKLSLADDIRKYVPELPDYGTPITIRHLIHHTSGLRDYWTLVSLARRRSEDVYDTEDMVELAARQKELNFKPGEQYLYSNTGYTLLAMIVKRATGQSLCEYAEEQIFKPLGMAHTRFNDDHTTILKNRAYGYSPRKGGGFQLNIVNNDLVGQGGLWTTVEDLLLWDQNFYSAKVGGSALIQQLLTLGTLTNGEKLTYAFGLSVDEYKGLKRISHGGAFAGYRAQLIRFPEQRFSVVVLCNLSTMNPTQLASQVADIYLVDQFKPGAMKTPAVTEANVVKLSEQELASKAGLYWAPVTEAVRRVSVKDGKLMAAAVELSPLGKNRFQMVGTSIELTFESPRQGGPLQLHEVNSGGKPVIYEAVQVVVPTPAQLAEYIGTYYSEELGTTYTLVSQDGKLILRHKKAEDIELIPMFIDAFMNDGLGNIRFTRDPQNRVPGFTLSAGRVKHLRFSKERR